MKNALLIQVKERKLEMGTKKKTKRVQTLIFSSEDEKDSTSLPYYLLLEKGERMGG